MILRIEDLKDVCSTILAAVDSNELSEITETLELKTENNTLCLNVTNKEYYAQVKIDLTESIDFHATVNANLFLRLVSQITSDTVELIVDNNNLNIKANGNYKIPLIFDDDKLLELPVITINNITSEFNISKDILNSIYKYNSRELLRGTIARPVQKLYYVDEQGCITFTSGACVNNFTLEKPVKVLFNNRLVKLFKLFKADDIKFSLGYDALSDDIIQTKVSFETADIKITSILSCDDSLLNSVPVDAIRDRANGVYDYSLSIYKDTLLQALNRLQLFNSGYGTKQSLKPYAYFTIDINGITITDDSKENVETIQYNNTLEISEPYEMIIDILDLKNILDICTEQYINLKFGNHKAIVISRNNINNVIPECRDN